ncbi:MAG: SpoIID/LytB domain-containing protein [Negativicutes bacterium]
MNKKNLLSGLIIALTMIFFQTFIAQAGFFPNEASSSLVPIVKIGLAIEKSNFDLSADAPVYLLDVSGKKVLNKFSANEKISLTSDGVVVVCNGKKYFSSVLISTKADDSSTSLIYNKHKFRGEFLVECSGKDKKALNLINVISLEKYLYSVIGSEISTAWPEEAVKAQAVAARSYAMYNLTSKKKYQGFDMLCDTSDQAYLGKVVEDNKGRKAVDDTRGMVVIAHGKIAQTLFMASGGGRTASSHEVWGNNCSYLQSVIDYDEKSPYYHWEKQVAIADFEAALTKNGFNCGAVEEILLSPLDNTTRDNYSGDRSPSGRVKLVVVIGRNNTVELSGADLRRIFELRSTLFEMQIKNGKVIFNGRGWGHGIGLSQWGAKQMAETKSNGGRAAKYQDILRHYYSGSELKHLY